MANFNCWLYQDEFEYLFEVRQAVSLSRYGQSGAVKRALAHCYKWQDKILPSLPPTQEHEGERALLCINFRAEEKAQLQELAAKTQDNLTDFIRRILLYYAMLKDEYAQKNLYSRPNWRQTLGLSAIDLSWDSERLQPWHSERLENEVYWVKRRAEQRAAYQSRLKAEGYYGDELAEKLQEYDEAPRLKRDEVSYMPESEFVVQGIPPAQERLWQEKFRKMEEEEEARSNRQMWIILLVLSSAIVGGLAYFLFFSGR